MVDWMNPIGRRLAASPSSIAGPVTATPNGTIKTGGAALPTPTSGITQTILPTGPQPQAPATPVAIDPGANLGATSSAPPGYIDPGAHQNPYGATLNVSQPGGVANNPALLGQGSNGVVGPQGNLSSMPYDAAYADQVRNLDLAQGQHDAALGQQQTTMRANEFDQERVLRQGEAPALQHLLDSFAARGMAHSGAYANAYGQQQDDWANQIGGYQGQLAAALAQMALQNADFGANLAGQRNNASQDYARRLAAAAGTLGIVNQPALTPGQVIAAGQSGTPVASHALAPLVPGGTPYVSPKQDTRPGVWK